MASVEDASQTRMVQRELGKRCIDISLMDVHVHHGVVYLRGVARQVRGQQIDLVHELQIVCQVLRQRPGIREIVNEVTVS
jgi:hypothetical protein